MDKTCITYFDEILDISEDVSIENFNHVLQAFDSRKRDQLFTYISENDIHGRIETVTDLIGLPKQTRDLFRK